MSQWNAVESGPKHPIIKEFMELKSNKRPNPKKKITVEGFWEVSAAVENNILNNAFIICPELIKSNEIQALLGTLNEKGFSFFSLSEKNFKKISDRDQPDGIAGTATLPIKELSKLDPKKTKTIAVLDGLEIPGNAGTIYRSVDGAGVDAVVILNRKFRLTHPKIIHASHGACFYLDIYEGSREDFFQYLQKNPYTLYLGDAKEGTSPLSSPFKKPGVVVIGSEKQGIHTDWYSLPHQKVKIPMKGKNDSLNTACAATLLLYQFCE